MQVRRVRGCLVSAHVKAWEAANGQIPRGRDVHHINGDRCDNRIENLRIVTRLEHSRIHAGWREVGSEWHKRCRRCDEFKVYETNFETT